MNWIKKLFGKPNEQDNLGSVADEINSKMDEIRQSGSVDGQHYTDSIEKVKQLKREGKHQDAINILLQAVDSTEKESEFAGEGWGVAPWYYEQLAIIYRKEKEYQKEVEILERYAAQPKAPGAGPQKLAERLAKAEELLAKQNKA
ncbi:MAG: hypothetical protein QNK15_00250 [Cycloclasticus sp.]|nr:hypothetical protein [Cycloclasticus sp.]